MYTYDKSSRSEDTPTQGPPPLADEVWSKAAHLFANHRLNISQETADAWKWETFTGILGMLNYLIVYLTLV